MPRRDRETEKRGPLQAGELINTLILKTRGDEKTGWRVQCVICRRQEDMPTDDLFKGSAVCTWCHTPRSSRAA